MISEPRAAVAMVLRCMRFKALNGTAPVIGKRVANHQANDLIVPLVDIIKKKQ